jgi:transcriptional regulator with XRE-family HTH domain
MTDNFGARLTLALKALSMTRGQLASQVGVDKSLTGRWASGAVQPSAHNLARVTRLLAERRPGLTLLDWERSLPEFAALFGVEPAPEPRDSRSGTLSGLLLEMAPNAVDSRVAAYEGFWRTTHASVFEPGRLCQQHGIIRQDEDGVLRFELGADGIRYGGFMVLIEGQVYAVANDSVRQVPSFLILNVVPMQKIVLLDGLLIAASSALRIPSAYSIIFQRIGDLSGNRDQDDAHADRLMDRPEFLEEDATPALLRDHLLKDTGPAAAAAGGDMMLSARLTPQLAKIIALTATEAGLA